MKFKEMSIEEFKKDFLNFLNNIKTEDLINSLSKYAIKEYSYKKEIVDEVNYIKCEINIKDNTKIYNKIYKYKELEIKYSDENMYIEVGAA